MMPAAHATSASVHTLETLNQDVDANLANARVVVGRVGKPAADW